MKKLQDFFTDAKVPREERRRVLLVVDDEKICAVVGYRVDERVQVKPTTRRMLELSISSLNHGPA